MGQGSALFSILSALYLALVLYILEKYLKNLKILVSILSFIDDGFLLHRVISNNFKLISFL